jgi:hypothetical protein
MSGELGRVLRWPLWSWRNLTITAVALLALLAFVGRATDGRASSLPAAAPATSTGTETAAAPQPATQTPTTTPQSPSAPTPPPAKPVAKQSATAVATVFVRAWATDGATRDAWYSAMQPWASTELLRALASTDPAQVPADRVVADARLVSSSKTAAAVVVPTDGGDVQVTLAAEGGGWKVTDIAPADAPPAAETPSLTRTTPGS